MTDKGTTSSCRDLLKNLGLSAITLLVTLLVLEIGVRTLNPQDPDFYNSEKFLRLYPPPGEPQMLIPNVKGNYTGVPVQINSIGLRDGEVAIPKPPGIFRVLVIGDSVTFGFGVRLEESYPKRLEALMNAGRNESAKRFEVINAGIPGVGLEAFLQLLKTKGPFLQPDLVLVGIEPKHIMDYDGAIAGTLHSKTTIADLLRPMNRLLLLHSQLYLYAYTKLKSILYQTGMLDLNVNYETDFLALQPPSDRQARAWTSSLKRLDEMIEEARGLGVPLVVVALPLEVQLDAQTLDMYRRTLRLNLDATALDGIPQRRLAEFARTHKVRFIDLLPRFREPHSQPLFLRNRSISTDWVHLSPAGNDLVAEEVLSELRRPEFIPSNGNR